MTRAWVIVAGIASLAVLAPACGKKAETSGPEATVRAFFDAVSSGDLDRARALLVKKDRESKNTELKQRALEYEIGATDVEADETTVHVRITDEGKTQEMPMTLVREEGDWRISMDRTMEKMVGFSMDDLADQLGKQMGEAMKGAMKGAMKNVPKEPSKDSKEK